MSRGRPSPLSRNLQVLMLEGCFYNLVASAPFTHNVDAMRDAYRQSDICGSLVKVTGEGADRVAISPLMGGQYEL